MAVHGVVAGREGGQQQRGGGWGWGGGGGKNDGSEVRGRGELGEQEGVSCQHTSLAFVLTS